MVVVVVYIIYLVLAIWAFCFIITNESRGVTLLVPATTAALHWSLMLYSKYDGYDMYPPAIRMPLYLFVDLLLLASIISCIVVWWCATDDDVVYRVTAIAANTLTCISVGLCVWKTYLTMWSSDDPHPVSRVISTTPNTTLLWKDTAARCACCRKQESC